MAWILAVAMPQPTETAVSCAGGPRTSSEAFRDGEGCGVRCLIAIQWALTNKEVEVKEVTLGSAADYDE